MLNKISSTFRVFKSEFSSQITVVKLAALFFALLVPMFAIFASENYDSYFKNSYIWRDKKDALSVEDFDKAIYVQKIIFSNALMPVVLIQGAIYGLFVRVGSILRDNSTLDKNRVSFLSHNKNLVAFAKIVVDFLLFAINMGLLCLLTPTLIINILGGVFSDESYSILTRFFISICFVYLFSSFGMRLINASLPFGKKKTIILGMWILMTIGYYIVGSSMTNNNQFYAFYVTNIDILIYIPFLNLIIPHLYASEIGNLELIHSVPLILHAIILVQIPWFIFSSNLKTSLCT